MSGQHEIAACRLARFELVTHDAVRLAEFYQQALGFRRLAAQQPAEKDFEARTGVAGGGEIVPLSIGAQSVDLLQFGRPGRPYPPKASASDLSFQHVAIVVTDIARAFDRLSGTLGWRAISTDGPQRLPASSGSVVAFKFRDPEGHPLELLQFPANHIPDHWKAAAGDDVCLGIDHSAISVSDPARSIAFYENLGLHVTARSLNQGTEQARLDGIETPVVDVIALAPRQSTPHLELLGYRSASHETVNVADNDVAATRLTFETEMQERADQVLMLRDPDGHRLVMLSASSSGKASQRSS